MTEQPSPTTHRIAYLAGHGVGPEVTAAASRALDHLSRRHGFRVDEIHPPFGAETLIHSGSALPPATQRATASADAILVAGATEPALAALRASVGPAIRVTRTLDALGDSTVYAPLDDTGMPAAVARALAAAKTAGGRVMAVGVDETWLAHLADHSPVVVDHRPLTEALELLAGNAAGTVIAGQSVGDALATAPLLVGHERLTASADLPLVGPGVFAPTHGNDHVDSGHGVADPTEMLLATALLLSEGLGLRDAGRALERSVSTTLSRTRMPMTSNGTIVRETTREFVDAVLALIPSARRDTDIAPGVKGMSVTG